MKREWLCVFLLGTADPVASGTPATVRDTLEVRCEGRPVGTLLHDYVHDSATGGIRETTRLRVANWMDRTTAHDTIGIEEARMYGSAGVLLSAFQTLDGRAGRSTWELAQASGGWVLTVTAGGVASSRPVTGIADNSRVKESMYAGIARNTIRPGDTWNDTTFELVSATAIVTTVRCVKTPGDGAGWWEFVSRDESSPRDERWMVDSAGRTLYQEIPPVFTAVKPSFAEPRPAGPAAVEGAGTVFSVPGGDGPRRGQRVVLELANGLTPDTTVSAMYEQDGAGWMLRPCASACGDGFLTAAARLPGASLRPTVTVQSDHPEVVALARRVTGTAGPCETVGLATRHVYGSIRKTNTATFSNAVETLRAGFGDCGEHAVLLAALLRSRGIVARVVYGLVYVERQRAFVYHAWVGLPSGDRDGWLFADPAFGHFPARNVLVPLCIDEDGSKAVYLSRLIGSVTIRYR